MSEARQVGYILQSLVDGPSVSRSVRFKYDSTQSFAIAKRNKWMLEQAEYCICYVNRTWGGAYRFASLASRRGLTVLNLGNVSF